MITGEGAIFYVRLCVFPLSGGEFFLEEQSSFFYIHLVQAVSVSVVGGGVSQK